MGTIQMKPNYTVETNTHFYPEFIVVDNYDSTNKVVNFQCSKYGKESLIRLDKSSKKTIGIWIVNFKNK